MARRGGGTVKVSITSDVEDLKRGTHQAETLVKRLEKTGKSSLGNLAKVAASAGAAFLSIGAAKTAITTTEELARTTLGLSRNLGLTVEEASRWGAVAKARNVDTTTLNASFTALSRAIATAADDSGSKYAKFLHALGFTQADIHRSTGDFNFAILKLADGFGSVEGGARRAAVAQALLGKSSQTTLPIFTAGSKALREQLELADKYHVTLKGKTIKSLEELVRAQRESEFATMGLNVAFGTFLAPTLTKGLQDVNQFVQEMQDGTGAGGKFAAKITEIAHALEPAIAGLGQIAGFVGDHPKLLAAAITAWAAWKLATFTGIAQVGKALYGIFTGAQRKRIVTAAATTGAEAGTAMATGMAGPKGSLVVGPAGGWGKVGSFIGKGIGAALAYEIAHSIATGIPALDQYSGKKGWGELWKDIKDWFPGADHDSPGQSVSGIGGGFAFPNRTSPFSSTSTVPFEGLQQLWVQAGGDPKLAPLMAHIAQAESGGRAGIINSIGATGLWQIYNGRNTDPGLVDPMRNARAAVQKYKTQGLGAWKASQGTWGKYVGSSETYAGGGDLSQLPGGLFGTEDHRNIGSNLPTSQIIAYIAKRWGLRFTSGKRSAAQNRAANGVENSDHLKGTTTNPGAADFVGSMSAMQAAGAWAQSQGWNVLIHDAGSGLHLHVGFGGPRVSTSETAGQLPTPPTGAELAQGMISPIVQAARPSIVRAEHSITSGAAGLTSATSRIGRIQQTGDLRPFDESSPSSVAARGLTLGSRRQNFLGLNALRRQQVSRDKSAIARYRTLIKQLQVAMKKAPPGGRQTFIDRIKGYQQRIADLKDDIRSLGGQISDTKVDIEALDTEIAGLGDNLPGALERGQQGYEAYQKTIEGIDAAERAGLLTPEQAKARKIAAANAALKGQLGTFENVVAVMGDIKEWSAAVDDNTAALEQSNTLLQQKIDLDAQVVANQEAILAVARSQPNVLLQAIVEALSGAIGGRVGLGFQTPGVAGTTGRI